MIFFFSIDVQTNSSCQPPLSSLAIPKSESDAKIQPHRDFNCGRPDEYFLPRRTADWPNTQEASPYLRNVSETAQPARSVARTDTPCTTTQLPISCKLASLAVQTHTHAGHTTGDSRCTNLPYLASQTESGRAAVDAFSSSILVVRVSFTKHLRSFLTAAISAALACVDLLSGHSGYLQQASISAIPILENG